MKNALLSTLKKVAPVLLLSTVAAMQAAAATVTTTHTGRGSGTFDGVAFEDVGFVITAFSDSDTVASCGTDCWFNFNISALITIDLPEGGGAYSFVTPTLYASNEGGIRLSAEDGTPLLDGPAGDPWNMATALEPRIGSGELFQWPGINTSGGLLVFNSGETDATFTAAVDTPEVPVPAGIWLFGSGLVGLVSVARRKAH